jgi:hypothetical protein
MRRVILASAISLVVGIGVGAGAMFKFQGGTGSFVSSTPKPSDEAIQAVRALTAMRSVIDVEVTYQNYLTRVGDTKIAVDRYLLTSLLFRLHFFAEL